MNDPITTTDIGWLRSEAGSVLNELVQALPPVAQARVKGIPLVPDPTVGDVNAFAACDDQGHALMAITDGLLDVEAHIAQYKAIDELWGTRKFDAYVQFLAQNLAQNKPIPRPQAFSDPSQDSDGRKVARQHQLMDEQLAFVMGHELSHHHLGHTGCANGASQGPTIGDLGRILSKVPTFNQPNEVAADISGTQNLLTAGSRRQGYHWNEEGAILTLDFFIGLEQMTLGRLPVSFLSTHPPAIARKPIVQNTAASWRATGGQGFQLPNLGGFLPQ
jgi:hypothetical protein